MAEATRTQIGMKRLLADAETRKNHAEQIVAAEFSGDLGQRVLGEAEFFGDEFTGAVVHEAMAGVRE
jgi:hypothetical protein